jgi:ribosomal protein S18 acetylase RimI-like enzyme
MAGEKQFIVLKKYIEDDDYQKLVELQNLCKEQDKVELKLELEYKLTVRSGQSNPLKVVNEFLYYAGEALVGYIGVSCFGRGEAELNGMVHPNWRRRGIFKRLYELAKDECSRRDFERILLLCDDKSKSAKAFIQATGASHVFSEYKMKLEEIKTNIGHQNVTIRKANNSDGEEIGRQNSIFFGSPNIQIEYPEEEEKHNNITYMLELKGKTIGKIKVERDGDLSYIYGFGILPEYRGKGYGREALAATIDLIKKNSVKNIYLDVEARNNTALNLYTSCGFVQEAVMNYYEAK